MRKMKLMALSVLAIILIVSVIYTEGLKSVVTPETERNNLVKDRILSEGELKNPTQYIFEVEGAPSGFDPAISYNGYSMQILELTYECLVNFKDDSVNDMEGKLATSWEVSENRLTYTFNLRQGVIFHDGTVFNAYVMKYSLDRAVIMNPYLPMGGEPAYGLQRAIKGESWLPDAEAYLEAGGIVVIDDYTLEINLEAPYADFIHVLASLVASAVSPVAVIEHPQDGQSGMVSLADWFGESFDPSKLGLPADHDLAISGVVPQQEHDWMAGNAVGTGPYKLVDVSWGSEVHLEKNTDWWGTFAEYSVNEVIIKTVESVEERLQHLRDGEADEISIVPPRLQLWDYSYADEVIDEDGNPVIEGTHVFDRDFLFTSPMGMNLHDALPYQLIVEDESSTYDPTSLARYAWGSQTASVDNPLTSLLFRKAVALAFDCDALISGALYGVAECMEGLIPNGLFGHHDQLVEEGYIPTYNPEAARELFQEVGWRGTITLLYAQENPALQQGYQQIADSITGLGVGITVDNIPVPWSTYIWAVRGGILPIWFCTWRGDYVDSDNYIFPFLHSENAWYPSLSGYSNPELDVIIEQAAIAPISDREELYHQIEEIAAMDYIYLYASQIHKPAIVRDWIIGYESSGSLNPTSFFTNVEHVGKALPATVEVVPKVINTVRGSPWITLYIELPYGINPMEIDLGTVTMSYEDFSQPAVTDPSYAWVTDPSVYIVDQDGDGVLERLVRIDRDAFIAGLGITDPGRRGTVIEIMVEGSLTDGTPFVAWSTVTIVSRGR
ncbi:MAG: ABC transporter substrate-binding protein [Promethearchaeota archaeon]